ncbi:MAG TPA: hypothetical protein PKY06_13325 [Saprospiraceae bacterium]|nr:hypothetical protein [Saprospiraceae bacterium]
MKNEHKQALLTYEISQINEILESLESALAKISASDAPNSIDGITKDIESIKSHIIKIKNILS